MSNDLTDNLREQVAATLADTTPFRISAGNSKTFYGNKVDAQIISTAGHQGITEYQPSELVVTVRSGTLLSELEAELKANKQMLAFEPPQHSANTTIGGTIACGLSGPRRAACGSARDFVLGTTIINGKAEKCRFGGQVMKNVAGYDAARLMVGAQGTLGILLDISIKVLPLNESELSIKINTELSKATKSLQQWIHKGLPITASCFINNALHLRLGSTHSAVKQSLIDINKSFKTEEIDETFWSSIKNQTHEFFQSSDLWRCSHQMATEFYGDTDKQLIEWNGALRWINDAEDMYETAEKYNGHAQRYPLTDSEARTTDIFQPLQPGVLKIHKRLKHAFDPENIMNPGRLYAEL